MDIMKKFDIIKYSSYFYNKKGKFNSNETKQFFDLEFSKLLCENASKVFNSQEKLLSFFDFKDIFDNFDNGVTDNQRYLIKFMAIRGVVGVDELLKNMPSELKFDFFYQLYFELHSKDNRPFYFSKIIFCLKQEDIIRFVNEIIENVTDDEIVYMIQELYKSKKDDILCELMCNERIMDIAVRRINAPFFYEMIEELKLSNIFLNRREENLKSILINYQDYSFSDVKEAFCDLYFHNTLNNSLLDIKTIIEFAQDDSILHEKYFGEIYNYFCRVFNFLNNNGDFSLSDIQIINSNFPINHEVLLKCDLICQNRFKELVSESIDNDITKNIESEILMSTNGHQVRLYNIEKQIENQENITMLISTIPCMDSASEFKKIYYSENNGEIKHNRRSCSLINQTRLQSLFGDTNHRIVFGFEDLTGRTITSATLTDGRTDGNDVRFRRKRKVEKNSYRSIDKFIAGTSSAHNEITINMGRTNEVMKPSYILITHDHPTQFEIDVASEFGIPIRHININDYKQEPAADYISESYDYVTFIKKEVVNLKKDRKLT